MLKTLKTKKNNKGNTFIVVMVTIATMGILVGVILATMGYFYRARMVDLNNKNNFYYFFKKKIKYFLIFEIFNRYGYRTGI